jgi:pyruvate formate lyase activating enzyme
VTGTTFDIKKFSIHDGPGIRTTVFFKGCPLRCVWCHNPEGQKTSAEIMFFPDRCTSCGTCVSICPNQAAIVKDVNHESSGIHPNQAIIRKDGDYEITGAGPGQSVVLKEGRNRKGGDGPGMNTVPANQAITLKAGSPKMDGVHVGQAMLLEDRGPEGNRGYEIHTLRKECIACGACVEACPRGAREVAGKVVASDELIGEIMKDVVFYDSSGGGVTFSGGEPLLQPDFLLALLKECKEREIHTAVDTCGFAKWETLSAIIPYADLILYDLKCMDSDMHFELTGRGNEAILENLRRLSKAKCNVTVRFPLIPGINDNEENITSMGEFLSSLRHGGRLPQVDILPYHKMGLDKYLRLGREYGLPYMTRPEDETVHSVWERLREFGLETRIEG